MQLARTVRIEGVLDARERRAAAALLAGQAGARVRFQASRRYGRTYALVEGGLPGSRALSEAFPQGRDFGEAIIVLAIEPTQPEALRALQAIFAGAGAPAGVCGCETCEGALLLEIAPGRTEPMLVLRIADDELRRYGAARRTQLLSALTVADAARIAAEGLRTPQIAPDRVLETLVADAGLA